MCCIDILLRGAWRWLFLRTDACEVSNDAGPCALREREAFPAPVLLLHLLLFSKMGISKLSFSHRATAERLSTTPSAPSHLKSSTIIHDLSSASAPHFPPIVPTPLPLNFFLYSSSKSSSIPRPSNIQKIRRHQQLKTQFPRDRHIRHIFLAPMSDIVV